MESLIIMVSVHRILPLLIPSKSWACHTNLYTSLIIHNTQDQRTYLPLLLAHQSPLMPFHCKANECLNLLNSKDITFELDKLVVPCIPYSTPLKLRLNVKDFISHQCILDEGSSRLILCIDFIVRLLFSHPIFINNHVVSL